jgi:predicted amidohydrolase
MKKVYLLLLVLHIFLVSGLWAQSAPAAASRTLIRAGHVLDVKTGAEPAAQTIVVTGDRITAVGPTASIAKQAGDVEIDLTKYTVMPGLIDVHTHLTMANNFDPYFELTMTPAKAGAQGGGACAWSAGSSMGDGGRCRFDRAWVVPDGREHRRDEGACGVGGEGGSGL